MKRACLIVFVVALMHAFVSAQQGGVNTSVLPARSNLQLPPGSVADEFLKTDLLAQKQVEGLIAASTRKPDRSVCGVQRLPRREWRRLHFWRGRRAAHQLCELLHSVAVPAPRPRASAVGPRPRQR